MDTNIWFFKLRMLDQFLKDSIATKQKVMRNLLANAADQSKKQYYLTLLTNLSCYEQQIINKIFEVDTTDINDLLNQRFCEELKIIADDTE